MALHRGLNPELVLCARCREQDPEDSRCGPYMNPDDHSVRVREVCAAPSCPELQVRGHFCVDHALNAELLSLQPVRVCSVCRVDVLTLYTQQQKNEEIWFILPIVTNNDRSMRGVEKRWPPSIPSPPPAVRSRRGVSKTPPKRRSARKLRMAREKEQARAQDFSRGLLEQTHRFLWADNKQRLLAGGIFVTPRLDPAERANLRPDPSSVFCGVQGCKRFAKTGDACRFHSDAALVFIAAKR